jgi:hypothetical protein
MDDVEKTLIIHQRLLTFQVFRLSMGNRESRRADSNR